MALTGMFTTILGGDDTKVVEDTAQEVIPDATKEVSTMADETTVEKEPVTASGVLDTSGLAVEGQPTPSVTTTEADAAYDAAVAANAAQDPTYADIDVTGVERPTYDRYDEEGKSKYLLESETVKGQLESLLSDESKYIQEARLRTAEQAAGRGMLNTTIAAQAGERAAIQEGFKIASQDSAQLAALGQAEQLATQASEADVHKTELAAALNKQEAQVQLANTKVQNSFEASMAKASGKQQESLMGIENAYQKQSIALQSQIDTMLLGQEIDSRAVEGARAASSQILTNRAIAMDGILTNPTILDMEDAEKGTMQGYIDIINNRTYNDLKFTGSIASVDFNEWVETYI